MKPTAVLGRINSIKCCYKTTSQSNLWMSVMWTAVPLLLLRNLHRKLTQSTRQWNKFGKSTLATNTSLQTFSITRKATRRRKWKLTNSKIMSRTSHLSGSENSKCRQSQWTTKLKRKYLPTNHTITTKRSLKWVQAVTKVIDLHKKHLDCTHPLVVQTKSLKNSLTHWIVYRDCSRVPVLQDLLTGNHRVWINHSVNATFSHSKDLQTNRLNRCSTCLQLRNSSPQRWLKSLNKAESDSSERVLFRSLPSEYNSLWPSLTSRDFKFQPATRSTFHCQAIINETHSNCFLFKT